MILKFKVNYPFSCGYRPDNPRFKFCYFFSSQHFIRIRRLDRQNHTYSHVESPVHLVIYNITLLLHPGENRIGRPCFTVDQRVALGWQYAVDIVGETTACDVRAPADKAFFHESKYRTVWSVGFEIYRSTFFSQRP
jgi:hypothetical protein